MKMVPLFKVSNMKTAIMFYTNVLDFELASDDDVVVDLVLGDMMLQLTTAESEKLFGSVVNISVEDVDATFEKYSARGLTPRGPKTESPVHHSPVDQSWGMRELYVTDADNNTLRFRQPIAMSRATYLNAWPYVEGRQMDLPVKDVQMAVGFYTGKLNFKEVGRTDTPVQMVMLARDKVSIAIAENGGDPTQEGCFFEVDSVEAAMKEIQLNGLDKNKTEIVQQNHGGTEWKVFFLVAPDGLCYCIGEKVK